MIRVNREECLRVLESVSPGLASKEILQQSTCLAFKDNRVVTFNDEVTCSRKSPFKDFEGAVKAKPLLDLLSKMKEDEVSVEWDGSEIVIKGKRKKSGIRMEAEVQLPVDAVETPVDWVEVNVELFEALAIVSSCTSGEESQFILTCVHIHPEFVEACDQFQIARYPLKTGVKASTLVRGESLKKIISLDMTHVTETDSWIHFKNPAGLVLSCRRYLDDYHDLTPLLVKEGVTPMTLPGGLDEVVDKASIFSAENSQGNNVIIDLQEGRAVIEGEGPLGWYKEMKEVVYRGAPIRFMMAPKLLLETAGKANDCGVGEGRLYIDTGKFIYVTCTTVLKKED